MPKMLLTEAKLKEMIKEAVDSILKEIGDTPAGYDAIRNAQDMADKLGRKNQSRNFENYADKIDAKKYDARTLKNHDSPIERATNKRIEYKSVKGTPVTIEANGNVYSNSVYAGNVKSFVVSNRLSDELKVGEPKYARKIAMWCRQVLGNLKAAEPEMTPQMQNIMGDWHTWCAM